MLWGFEKFVFMCATRCLPFVLAVSCLLVKVLELIVKHGESMNSKDAFKSPQSSHLYLVFDF